MCRSSASVCAALVSFLYCYSVSVCAAVLLFLWYSSVSVYTAQVSRLCRCSVCSVCHTCVARVSLQCLCVCQSSIALVLFQCLCKCRSNTALVALQYLYYVLRQYCSCIALVSLCVPLLCCSYVGLVFLSVLLQYCTCDTLASVSVCTALVLPQPCLLFFTLVSRISVVPVSLSVNLIPITSGILTERVLKMISNSEVQGCQGFHIGTSLTQNSFFFYFSAIAFSLQPPAETYISR